MHAPEGLLITKKDKEMQEIKSNHVRKIFVIEDNRTEGMLLKLCLSAIKNVTITNFSTGTELLNHLDENPDIVIVDMHLPDIPGHELVKQINKSVPTAEIIVVSAQRDIDMIAKVQELGIFNYLVKSESCIEYLQKVIENLIIILDHRLKSEKP